MSTEVKHKEVKGKITIDKEQAAKALEDVRKNLQSTTEASIAGFNTAARAAQNFSSILTQVSIMSFVYNLIQRRIEHSTLQLAEATEKYEINLAKFGETSAKTASSLRKMNMAQADLNRAQREGALNTAILLVQMAMLGVRIVGVIGKVLAYKVSVDGATIADLMHIKVLSAKLALMAAVTAGVFLLIGALAMAASKAQTEAIMAGATPSEYVNRGVDRARTPASVESGGTVGTKGISIHSEPHFTITDERDIDNAYDRMSEETKRELRRHQA